MAKTITIKYEMKSALRRNRQSTADAELLRTIWRQAVTAF